MRPMWAREIDRAELEGQTAELLICRLSGLSEMYLGLPAKNQESLSKQRRQTNDEIEKIRRQASKLSNLMSRITVDCENAFVFAHLQDHSLSLSTDEWFTRQLQSNLETLLDAADRAKSLRQIPKNRPKDEVLLFWIDRIIEAFYQCAPTVEITDKRDSLFFRTTELYLSSPLNLTHSDMQKTVKGRIKEYFS